jgi:hypothetical protein
MLTTSISLEDIMKSQQGFVIFGGVAWLAAAALSGGFITTVESATDYKTTATAQKQNQPALTLAAAPVAETPAVQPDAGSLYRNSGHVGDNNSDVTLGRSDP